MREGDGERRSPWRRRAETLPSSAGSIRLAIAGSPRKPMPIEAIVIPIWQVDRYLSMPSSCFDDPASAAVARLGQRLEPRDRRERTSANSAATNIPLTNTRTTRGRERERSSAISCSRAWTVWRLAVVGRAWYFEVGRRQSLGDVARLAAKPDVSKWRRGYYGDRVDQSRDPVSRRAGRAGRHATPGASTSPGTRAAPAPTGGCSRRSARRP